MSSFCKLKVFILFIVSLTSAQLLMNYGYATYLPRFGSWVNDDYITIMRFHFTGLGLGCALITFYLSKIFLLKFKVSQVIFLLSGLAFNLYSPEGRQYHWKDGYIELSFLYLFFGILVLYILNYAKKSV